jgi:hypothetical protein
MAANGNTEWHIVGDEVGNCNCVWACPCQFDARPSEGHCEAIIGYAIREGHFGDTDLGGVKFAEIVHWPGAIHEGNGTQQLIVDESASEAQREAIEKLVSGEYGGTYFEIFASVMSTVREPITASIEIESDRERRIASLRVGEIAESSIEPIKNPVDGSEHRVRIDLPNGFEYRIAEIGNTVSAKSRAEAPLDLTLENSYGQLNEFDWAPA